MLKQNEGEERERCVKEGPFVEFVIFGDSVGGLFFRLVIGSEPCKPTTSVYLDLLTSFAGKELKSFDQFLNQKLDNLVS